MISILLKSTYIYINISVSQLYLLLSQFTLRMYPNYMGFSEKIDEYHTHMSKLGTPIVGRSILKHRLKQ